MQLGVTGAAVPVGGTSAEIFVFFIFEGSGARVDEKLFGELFDLFPAYFINAEALVDQGV